MRKLPERRGDPPASPSLGSYSARSHPRPDGQAAASNSVQTELPRPFGRWPSVLLRPDGVPVVRRLARRPAVVEPLAPARYKVQFTASAELHDKLERLRALMRSSVPDGDLAAIIEQAVTEKLERLESRRFARTKAPRKVLAAHARQEATLRRLNAGGPGLSAGQRQRTRHTPHPGRGEASRVRAGRRPMPLRGRQGRRCTARERLEFHHRRPFGHGGDHSVENISLACRAHNGYLAEVDYGREAMAMHRRSRRPSRGASICRPHRPSGGRGRAVDARPHSRWGAFLRLADLGPRRPPP